MVVAARRLWSVQKLLLAVELQLFSPILWGCSDGRTEVGLETAAETEETAAETDETAASAAPSPAHENDSSTKFESHSNSAPKLSSHWKRQIEKNPN